MQNIDLLGLNTKISIDNTPTCGQDGCVFQALNKIVSEGVDPVAGNAAKDSLIGSVQASLTATGNDIIRLIGAFVIILIVAIFIPILIILIAFIWIYTPTCISYWAAVSFTILAIIIFAVVGLVMSIWVLSFLAQQIAVIRTSIVDYIDSQDFLAALNEAACTYLNFKP